MIHPPYNTAAGKLQTVCAPVSPSTPHTLTCRLRMERVGIEPTMFSCKHLIYSQAPSPLGHRSI